MTFLGERIDPGGEPGFSASFRAQDLRSHPEEDFGIFLPKFHRGTSLRGKITQRIEVDLVPGLIRPIRPGADEFFETLPGFGVGRQSVPGLGRGIRLKIGPGVQSKTKGFRQPSHRPNGLEPFFVPGGFKTHRQVSRKGVSNQDQVYGEEARMMKFR